MSHREAAWHLIAQRGYRLQHMRVHIGKVPAESVALARVVEPETVAHENAIGAVAGLEAAFLAFLQSRSGIAAASPGVLPIDRRIFLNMTEAAEFSGLPSVFLRRLITSGKLKALKTGAGWRIARVELEKLAGTLTEMPEDLTEHQLRDMEINRLRRQGISVPPAN
jgi:excisionase family DNA binding protein